MEVPPDLLPQDQDEGTQLRHRRYSIRSKSTYPNTAPHSVERSQMRTAGRPAAAWRRELFVQGGNISKEEFTLGCWRTKPRWATCCVWRCFWAAGRRRAADHCPADRECTGKDRSKGDLLSGFPSVLPMLLSMYAGGIAALEGETI